MPTETLVCRGLHGGWAKDAQATLKQRPCIPMVSSTKTSKDVSICDISVCILILSVLSLHIEDKGVLVILCSLGRSGGTSPRPPRPRMGPMPASLAGGGLVAINGLKAQNDAQIA